MSGRLCHKTASLSFFLIIAGLCQCAPLEKLRDRRDTRGIPSNAFRPIASGSSNTEPRSTATARDSDSNGTLFEQSAAQAHVHRGIPEFDIVNQPSQDQVFRDFNRFPSKTQSLSPRFDNPLSNYNTYDDVLARPIGYRVSSSNNLGSASFPGRGFAGQMVVGSPMMRRPFPDGGDSSSNNYYRSESYSYNSDGNGPPQIEQSVYDSRLGQGIHHVHRF